MNSSPSSALSSAPSRALVLGGGGSAGNAWEIGVIAGLHSAGVDLSAADLIVGTSAGATAAAQITAQSSESLYAEAIGADSQEARPARPRPGTAERGRPEGTAEPSSSTRHWDVTTDIIDTSADPAEMRRRIGAAALAAASEDDGPDWGDKASGPLANAARERRLAVVASRLPAQDWPHALIRLTAVDARTGELVVFDRESGVRLADAVTASTASGFIVPPHRIAGRDYLDGGYRRNENADLAAGFERVVVLSPLGGRSRHPESWGSALAVQVAELEAGGSLLEVITPDAASQAAFRGNMMNLAARPAAARAGHAQGAALAPGLAALWNGAGN